MKVELSLAQRFVLLPIRASRRFLSPLKTSPSCRFHPTCSKYALDAVKQRGALRGSVLALRRLLKCHPFHPGGFDPVPVAAPTTKSEGKHQTESGTLARTSLDRRNFER